MERNKIEHLLKNLKNKKVLKPNGILSGHAVGEPFDKLVTKELKKFYSNKIYRQYEFLNDLFLKNPKHISYSERQSLFSSPSVLYLLSRGKEATIKWEIEKQFEEKQNDTADVIYVNDNKYELIDVKTRNTSKKAMPPNIISAYKLAILCSLMIDNNEFDTINMNYLEIDWETDGNYLVCTEAHWGELFKEKPSNLYINWAAALQIQFNIYELQQDYNKNLKSWCYDYIAEFVECAKARSNYMILNYVKPFEKYLK